MPKRNVRCPYGGHLFQVEIKEGYVIAKAVAPTESPSDSPGHNQSCPICNRQLYIKYIP
jgi:hypothetical protein